MNLANLNGFGPIAEQLRRSTVLVAVSGRLPRQTSAQTSGQGSGVIVRSDGVIATNAHVVSAAARAGQPIMVHLWDGSSFPAKLFLRSTQRDLAMLRIPAARLLPVTLANSDELRIGELVVAVGNPLGFTGAVSTGVVHAIGRRRGLGETKWIHSGVQLAPGNSGGPLADARGRVVGINTMIAGRVSLAVPSNSVRDLLARTYQTAAA